MLIIFLSLKKFSTYVLPHDWKSNFFPIFSCGFILTFMGIEHQVLIPHLPAAGWK